MGGRIMKKTVRIVVLLAVFGAFSFGCSGSGNGGGGTVTVSVTGLETPFEVPVLAYGVFDSSADWQTGDPYVAYATDYVVEGSVSCVACVADSETTWKGSVGDEYYVIVFVTEYNVDEEYSPLDGGNRVVGSANEVVPYNFVLEEDTVLAFTDSDFTTIFVEPQ
jgi:hypothetical protein